MHTPQDVIVGFCESVAIICVVGAVRKRMEGNDRLPDILTGMGLAVVAGTLIYITLKPYPMDYVDGKLLVDPQVMMNDTFKACGGLLGFLIGGYVDRHSLHYEIPVGSPQLPMLACSGAAIMFAWSEWFGRATVIAAFGGHWGNLLA